jgi:hypothetical protein
MHSNELAWPKPPDLKTIKNANKPLLETSESSTTAEDFAPTLFFHKVRPSINDQKFILEILNQFDLGSPLLGLDGRATLSRGSTGTGISLIFSIPVIQQSHFLESPKPTPFENMNFDSTTALALKQPTPHTIEDQIDIWLNHQKLRATGDNVYNRNINYDQIKKKHIRYLPNNFLIGAIYVNENEVEDWYGCLYPTDFTFLPQVKPDRHPSHSLLNEAIQFYMNHLDHQHRLFTQKKPF